ncbi:hypothetical protein ATANTOWER_024774 [Ataeniobius toweri]|uniref:Uncharacterized protein n=1 Tax=Ataeniobius toweri TaxID=208326 RepID=A0ABU7C0E4_9TELE|nr:hypothetical protein [Ataeniobius toweri]
MWPPKNTSYLKALKENMQPNHNWIPYDNVRLLLNCDSYNKAKRFEDKSVRTGSPTTELESEEEVLERTKRRARPNPIYIDSEEEAETSSAKRRFAKPPEINFPGTTTLSQYSRTPNLNTSGISMIDNQACQYTDEDLTYLTELQAPTTSNVGYTPACSTPKLDFTVHNNGIYISCCLDKDIV